MFIPSRKRCLTGLLAAIWGWLWPRMICALLLTGVAYVFVEVALPGEQQQRRAAVSELDPELLHTVLTHEVPCE